MSSRGSGKRWELSPSAPPGAVEREGVPPAIASVLYHRGLTTRAAIDAFLDPSEDNLHDPFLLPDMEPAVQRLAKAASSGETVGILGDFDVDGVSVIALQAIALEQLGARVVPYLPHRVREGHGPNPTAIMELAKQGCTVMVTVDCGVTSLDEVSLARQQGLEVIITDHHTPRPQLPEATAVIDPKVAGNAYPFLELSGAGLAFKLVQGLYQRVGQPWDPELLGLAAIGTIADVAPLVDENRYLVKKGLEHLAATRRPGFLALYRSARITPQALSGESVSFGIAPRLNAAGRLDNAIIAYRLLTTSSESEASSLADQLEHLNEQRRRLTEEANASAREEIDGRASIPPILLVGRNWYQPGIAGLVASRLVDQYHRPAVAMCMGPDLVRASARSIPEFNMVQALTACADLFQKFGGHPQAAGFTMKTENLESLSLRLEEIAGRELAGQDLAPSLHIDAQVQASSLAGDIYAWCKALAPFGEANPNPHFLTKGLRPVETRHMGDRGQHLRLKLKEDTLIIDAVAFNQGEQWDDSVERVDVVYEISTEYRGSAEVLSLRVLDLRPSAL